MAPIRFILAATDFSAEGNNAVWRAAALARQSAAHMGIVHVVDPAGYQALRDWKMPAYQLDRKELQATGQLSQLAIDVAHAYGVTPSVHVKEGDVSQEVARVAEAADLLVLGRPHKRRFRDLLKARTADQILRASPRPVLVARNPVNGPYARILVPLDFSVGSDAALRAARQLAPDLTLQLFHALDPAGDTIMREAEVPAAVVREVRAREDAGALARMRRHVARLGLDHRAMQFSVGRGRSSQATAEHARQHDAELMVISRTGRWSFGQFLRANVSTGLLQSSACDVLVLARLGDTDALSQGTGSQPRKLIGRSGGRLAVGPGLSAGAGASLRNNSQLNWLGGP